MPAHAEPGADQPELPPVYSGPTPANPFGGNTFDIFDVMEQADQESSRIAAEPVAATEPPSTPALILNEPEPTEALSADAAQAPVIEPSSPAQWGEPEPTGDEPTTVESASTQAQIPEPPEPEPVAANDPEPEPAVKPIVIGSAQDVVVEKKRGWWRR